MKQILAIDLSKQQSGISSVEIAYDAASDGWFLYAYTDLDAPPVQELWHMTREDAIAQAKEEWGVNETSWRGAETETEATTKTLDANGAQLMDGDTVTLIKDLDVKGANTTLKRGTTIKNIRLTNDPTEIDCPSAPIRGLVLKSCFVKKG